MPSSPGLHPQDAAAGRELITCGKWKASLTVEGASGGKRLAAGPGRLQPEGGRRGQREGRRMRWPRRDLGRARLRQRLSHADPRVAAHRQRHQGLCAGGHLRRGGQLHRRHAQFGLDDLRHRHLPQAAAKCQPVRIGHGGPHRRRGVRADRHDHRPVAGTSPVSAASSRSSRSSRASFRPASWPSSCSASSCTGHPATSARWA